MWFVVESRPTGSWFECCNNLAPARPSVLCRPPFFAELVKSPISSPLLSVRLRTRATLSTSFRCFRVAVLCRPGLVGHWDHFDGNIECQDEENIFDAQVVEETIHGRHHRNGSLVQSRLSRKRPNRLGQR